MINLYVGEAYDDFDVDGICGVKACGLKVTICIVK